MTRRRNNTKNAPQPPEVDGLAYLGVAPVAGPRGKIDRSTIRFAPEFGGTRGAQMASRTSRRQASLDTFGTVLANRGHRAAFSGAWENDGEYAGDDGFGVWEGDDDGGADDGFGRRRRVTSNAELNRRWKNCREERKAWEKRADKWKLQALRAKKAGAKHKGRSARRLKHMETLKAQRAELRAERTALLAEVAALKAAAAAAPQARPAILQAIDRANAQPQEEAYPTSQPQYPVPYQTHPSPHPDPWNAGYPDPFAFVPQPSGGPFGPDMPGYAPQAPAYWDQGYGTAYAEDQGAPAYWDQGYAAPQGVSQAEAYDPWSQDAGDQRLQQSAQALMDDAFGGVSGGTNSIRAARNRAAHNLSSFAGNATAFDPEDPYEGYLGGCGCS